MALITCNFLSEVLDLCTTMIVVLPQRPLLEIQPAAARKNQKYQTLYLLHGLSDDHTIWQRRTSIERYADLAGLAVVMPAVDRSFYTDMARGNRYWTFVSEELPAVARSFFPLSADRQDNFVAGLSMGGYGAFKLALSHPGRFAAGASLSGALDIAGSLHWKDPLWQAEMKNVFGDLKKVPGSQSDLFHLAQKVAESKGPKPRLYQWCGTGDFLYPANLKFRDHAKSLNLDLTYEDGPGTHEWAYWDRQIQRVIGWLPLQRSIDYFGVIILESLVDQSLLDEVTVLQESDVKAPKGDPYPLWRRRLVRLPAFDLDAFAARLADNMKEDFYNHFVDDRRLVVVFKGKYFVLDKNDRSSWTEMIHFGETVRVGPRWTKNIIVEKDRLLVQARA
jgi:putative tributyrin esterase